MPIGLCPGSDCYVDLIQKTWGTMQHGALIGFTHITKPDISLRQPVLREPPGSRNRVNQHFTVECPSESSEVNSGRTDPLEEVRHHSVSIHSERSLCVHPLI